MKWSRLFSVTTAALLAVLLTGCLPIPVIDVSPSVVRANQPFTADGSGTIVSNVPAGNVAVSYRWDFGDGNKGSGREVSHTYSQPGNYTIVLTVIDSAGRDASTETSLTVLPALPRSEENSESEEDEVEEET